jgi:hypothetical protein
LSGTKNDIREKNDIRDRKRYQGDISFLCPPVLNLIKAQVCDNSVYYIKKLHITQKIAPKKALKHNAESAIIVTCEITINNSHVRLSFFISGTKLKH